MAAATPAAAAPCRALQYAFTADCFGGTGQSGCAWNAEQPDLGPQIAVWIESADGARVVDTLMVTDATALFGIGNRPGEWDLRSGPKFPYGRRPMVLPIWAHARGASYPLVVMQDGEEGKLTFHEGDSSPEPRFCRPMVPSEEVDAVTCPSGMFRSDKGRLDATKVSLYPPRADLLDFGQTCPYLPNRPSGSCNPGDSAQYAFLNDVDAVAAATPVFGVPSVGTGVVPDTVGPGDYALMVEVGKEFDTNAAYDAPNAPSLDYDVFGTPGNIGQPSVVYRVPFTLDAEGSPLDATTAGIYGYGDWTGGTGTVFPPDGSISSEAGSGEGRLALTEGWGGTGRVHLAITDCVPIDCSSRGPPPPVPIEVPAGELTATTAVIQIRQVGDGETPVLAYDIRAAQTNLDWGMNISPSDFSRWTPSAPIAPAVVGTTADTTFPDLVPDSDYAVGVIARGRCGNSTVSFTRFHTPRRQYERLHGCFIATAAFGSSMAAEAAPLRALRDRAEAASVIARIATDLYYRAAPAASRPLLSSGTARALVRVALRPVTVVGSLVAGISSGPASTVR